MFQRCRRGGSVIVIALLVIIATAAAHKRRYSGVKSAFARTRRPHGSRRHLFARQRLFRRGKSFCTLGRLFLPSWDPGKHLQRRFDPGFMEQKSQGRQLRMKGPRVVLQGGRRAGQILRLLRLHAFLHLDSFEAGYNVELRLPVTKAFQTN